jgi:predicted nucleotidyltransferase
MRLPYLLVALDGVLCYDVAMEKYAPADDPVLQRFKAALQGIYRDQIDRVVLFGSRARGEARTDSDYDIAVFLKELPDAWKERFRLASLRVDFLDETGAFIDAKPYPGTAYRDRTPLMHEIRLYGLDL